MNTAVKHQTFTLGALCNSFYPKEKNRILLQLFSFVDKYTKVGVQKYVINDTYANILSQHLQIWESNISDSDPYSSSSAG